MSTDAMLRLRDLRQLVFDVGDEVADYIDHVAQAMADWDSDLIEDCLVELEVVIRQARSEARPAMSELNGLRQALTSGLRSGTLSATQWVDNKNHQFNFPGGHHPGQQLGFVTGRELDSSVLPDIQPLPAQTQKSVKELLDETTDPHDVRTIPELRSLLRTCNEIIVGKLEELEQWVLSSTESALGDKGIILPQVFSNAEREVLAMVHLWKEYVCHVSPELVEEMHGENTPDFLAEREWLQNFMDRYTGQDKAGAVG